MTNPRVLLYCPVIDKPLPETAKAIKRLTFDGSVTIEIGRENPYGKGDYRNVLAQYEHAWDMALDGGYDALLTIEHDIIPPSDALEQLWRANVPVAFGMYRFRTCNIINLYRNTTGRAPDQSYSIFPEEWEKLRGREVIPVSGVGWGCTLIRSSVLREVKPRAVDETGLSVDIAFASDCQARKIKMYGVPGVVCGHIHEGKTLWPFALRDMFIKVRCLQSVNIETRGRTLSMKRGGIYEIEETQEIDLWRAGYIEALV